MKDKERHYIIKGALFHWEDKKITNGEAKFKMQTDVREIQTGLQQESDTSVPHCQ